jgi:hypothetical protein
LSESLYSIGEQLDRLVARIYGIAPPTLPVMSAKDAQTYSTALDSWVPEHPFLDGGRGASSAVFDAAISTHALRGNSAADAAVEKELHRGAAANPFLAEFYVPDDRRDERIFLPPAHIGIFYASLRARLSLGDSASLSIDAPEEAQDEEALRAEVEISLARRDSDRLRIRSFDSEQAGAIRLGPYVEDVEIDAPHAKIVVGPGPEAIFVAPVSIQCDKIEFAADKVIAEPAAAGLAEAAIYLEAKEYVGNRMNSVPVARGKVSVAASWPGVKNHPWTSFASDPLPIDDPRVDEALRRFRKFVIAFRSHSKGNLARYQHKIEHSRMTKGMGNVILKAMLAEKILTLNGSMYFLDPDLLGKVTGASYADCMSRRFSTNTVDFIKKAIAD